MLEGGWVVRLTSIQKDRAGGVLLGQAIGDALGVPYEFGPRIAAGEAAMIGGGLGPYAPGEWSDDTQMAICIAEATASGGFTGDETLAAIARAFVDWRQHGASDIGAQTASVLGRADAAGDPLAAMRAASEQAAAADRAGNGALMRTSVVGLVALDDPERTAVAASAIAALTHAHPLCVESAVLWSEAVRVAVLEGRLDVRGGVRLLPEGRRGQWLAWIEQAETEPPASFDRNGFTVTALQAAWSAIHATRHLDGPDQVAAALQAAIAIGHDTDTVAAIAGGLLGARYGTSGLPTDLARRVHGWPNLRGRDLVALGLATATRGVEAPEPAPSAAATRPASENEVSTTTWLS
nr:ADP-ribosylglycohydrolase family protein [Propionibacterium sp.]